MEYTTVIHLFFNGTGVQAFHDLPQLQKFADDYYEKMIDEKMTPTQINHHCVSHLSRYEQEMCDHFRDEMFDTKKLCKFWGKEALIKYITWVCCVLIGLKMGAIKQDKNNGTHVMHIPLHIIKDIGGKEYGQEELWQKCSNQECKTHMGNFKKCSKCKKVRYCCRECQVTDWKNHKPDCHC